VRRPGRAVLAALLTAVCGLAVTTAATSGAFTAAITDTANTAGTATYFTCAAVVAPSGDGANALFAWPLDETTGTTAADASGHNVAGTYAGTPTDVTGSSLACPRDTGGAYQLNGSSDYVTQASDVATAGPTSLSVEVWFKSTVASGMLVGFGTSRTGASSSVDRLLFISNAGKLVFGLDPGKKTVLTTSQSVNDGSWHQAAVTVSPSSGTRLYLDGASVASDAGMTTGRSGSGYWRVGYDEHSVWSRSGKNPFFTGGMRYAAVYPSVLTASQVSAHYVAGR
jgi:hypothetical protein